MYKNAQGRLNPVFSEAMPPLNAELFIPESDRDNWEGTPYRANTYKMEALRIKALSGIMVRSKSENAILEIYKKLDIPVHYDELLLASGELVSPEIPRPEPVDISIL